MSPKISGVDAIEFFEDFFSEKDIFDDKNKLEVLSKIFSKFGRKSEAGESLKNNLKILKDTFVRGIKEIVDVNYFNKPGVRILQMGIPYSIQSGVVTVQKNITKAFQMNGANIAVINHWWHEYFFWKNYRIPGLRRKKKVKMSPFSLLTGDGKFIEIRWALKHVTKDLLGRFSYNPQLIHVHTHTFFYDDAIQYMKKQLPNIPLVFTLHAFIPYIKLNRDQRERLLSDMMSKEEIMSLRKNSYVGRERAQESMIALADRVITISETHQEAFIRFYPEYRDKCVCIPNGTDFELVADLKEVYNYENRLRREICPNGERTVIYVGRIEEQKGSRKLFEGFNLIAKKYHDVKLILVGPEGVQKQKLIDSGLDPNYINRVHFAGWIKDRRLLAAYYRIADMMVQPVASRNLYAMVALEAMILKVPVVSCPGDLTIGHTKTPEDILAAADHIFSNPEAVKRHVENIREKVLNDYSLNAVYLKHDKLYSEIIR